MTVWLNGEITENAAVSPRDRGVLLGDGVFETLRVREGLAVWGMEHLASLSRAADELRIPLPYDAPAMMDGMTALIEAAGVSDGALRITATRGEAPRGLAIPDAPNIQVLMTAGPPPAGAREPVRLAVSTVTRRNEFSPISRFKTLNYLDNILALDEARRTGFDDALMLNTQGNVAGGSYANLFVASGDRLLTPPLSDGVRAGVTREKVINDLGAREFTLVPGAVMAADEAFLANSFGVRPVIAVGKARLPVGPAARAAQELLTKAG